MFIKSELSYDHLIMLMVITYTHIRLMELYFDTQSSQTVRIHISPLLWDNKIGIHYVDRCSHAQQAFLNQVT